MKRILSKIYNASPKEIVRCVGQKLRRPARPASGASAVEHQAGCVGKAAEVAQALQQKFGIYTTRNLQGVTAEAFASALQARMGTVDASGEGYAEHEIERQRDLSIKFHWGHNHDFGDFRLEGRMGDRHISVLANFMALFPVSFDEFKDAYVLDVGCWTGGTTLLLATLAHRVCALEEVKKYAETVSYLTKAFGLSDRVSVRPLSIYDCNDEEFSDRFDIVYFPGVIYHLSDPLLALRILCNATTIGGFILVESAGIRSQEPLCRFDGGFVHYSGEKERLSSGGWNWFVPSPAALGRMMKEAGFDEVQTQWHGESGRVYGFGRKLSQVGICKAGLSVRNIR